MKLPEDVRRRADAYADLPQERKQQIVEHLEASGGARLQATVDQIKKNGGPEAAFVAHLFGRDVATDPGAAPDNKKINSPQVKETVLPRTDPNNPGAGEPQPFGHKLGAK